MVKISLNIEEQRQISRKIVSILKSQFTARFGSNHQAAGVVSELNIESSDTKLIRQMKFYIHKTLAIELEKIKNHGNIDYNFLVKLSELSEDSISRINMEYIRISPKAKTELMPVVLPVITETKKADNSSSKISKKKSKDEESISDDKYAILMFLNSVIRFEASLLLPEDQSLNKKANKFCVFDKVSYDNIFTLHCLSQEVRDIAYEALIWYMGHPSEEDVVNKFKTKDLLLNFSKMRVKDKTPSGISYCLPPKDGVTEEEIGKRLRRVSIGCFPSFLTLEEGNTFHVIYKKKSTASKMLKLVSEMNWNVSTSDDGEGFVCKTTSLTKAPNNSKSLKKDIDEASLESNHTKEESSERVVVLTEEKESLSSVLTIIEKEHENKYAFPSVLASHLFDTKEEALQDLNAIFEDTDNFIKLPKEVQQNIIFVLRKAFKDELKSKHPVEYALHLLNFLNS